MSKSFPARIVQPVTIVIASLLAILAFRHWGWIGSLILIAFWGAIYLGAWFWIKRGQKRIRMIVSQMSGQERDAVLRDLSEKDRSEVIEALNAERRHQLSD